MAIFNSKLTISMAIFYISGPWLKVGSTAAPEALEVDPKPSQKQKQSSAGQGRAMAMRRSSKIISEYE